MSSSKPAGESPAGAGGVAPLTPSAVRRRPLLDLFIPNRIIPAGHMRGVWLGWFAVAMLWWQFWPSDLLPRPGEVANAFHELWFEEGLGQHLIDSYAVQVKALLLAAAASLLLAYAAAIPVIRPAVQFISTWRFVSLGPLVIFFTLLVTPDGHSLKVALLVFAVAVFYITSMVPVVLDVPTEELDHARTMRMSEWRTMFEVVILGRLDTAVEMFRQNAAMGWMMLTMVEGLVRSEGGIGTLLLNQLKHFQLAEVAAIILVLFIVGFLQDLAIRIFRSTIFPYADLEKERR